MLASFLSFIFKLEDKRMCGCLTVCFRIWLIGVLYCLPWCGHGGDVQKADIPLGFRQCLFNLECVWAFNFFLSLFLVILAPWVLDTVKLNFFFLHMMKGIQIPFRWEFVQIEFWSLSLVLRLQENDNSTCEEKDAISEEHVASAKQCSKGMPPFGITKTMLHKETLSALDLTFEEPEGVLFRHLAIWIT